MKFNGSNHSKWDFIVHTDFFLNDFFFHSYWVLYKLHEQEDWLSLILLLRVPYRGETKLNGARGKKQVCRPCIRNWGLSEAYVLNWRKYLRHCWDFLAPPQPLGAPIVTWRRGIAPLLLPSQYTPGAVSWRFLRCCSYMRDVQVNFLICK